MGAIVRSHTVLLILSGAVNDSQHVQNELAIAEDRGVDILPFRVDEAEPAAWVSYFIIARQQMQGGKSWRSRLSDLCSILQQRARHAVPAAESGKGEASRAARISVRTSRGGLEVWWKGIRQWAEQAVHSLAQSPYSPMRAIEAAGSPWNALAWLLFALGLLSLVIAWDQQLLCPFLPADIVRCRALVRRYPDVAGFRYDLEKASYRHGRYADAASEFLEAYRLKPTSSASLWALYLTYRAARAARWAIWGPAPVRGSDATATASRVATTQRRMGNSTVRPVTPRRAMNWI